MKTTGIKKGFTVVELLIVVAIVGTLASIVLVPFMGFRDTKVLDATADDIVSLLSEARQDTLLSKGASQYGVHFEATRMVYFKGTMFSEPNVNNKEVIFDSIVQLSSILFTGGDDVVFQRLTGKTTNSGSTTLQVVSDTSREIIIIVEPTGVIGF